MEATEYPTFTTEKDLPQLTLKQHVMVAIEGSPVLTLVFCAWFVAVVGTMVAQYTDGTFRFVVLGIAATFFVTSGIIFWYLLKSGYLEKPRHNSERYYLKRMGVDKPMRFLREHPLHLAAYIELDKDLSELRNSLYSRDGIRMVRLPAMLVFTGPDRYTSGPLIQSIIEERDITDAGSIAAILKEVEHNPPVLNEGAL